MCTVLYVCTSYCIMRGCLRRMSTPDAARMFASVDAVPAFEEHGGRVRVSFGVALTGTLNIYYLLCDILRRLCLGRWKGPRTDFKPS